jgi:anti-anti-sigma regulatory factor
MIPHYCYHFSSFGFQLLVRTTQVASTSGCTTKLTEIAPQVGDHVKILKTHKSERHLAVIMKPADLFTQLGYEIERQSLHL